MTDSTRPTAGLALTTLNYATPVLLVAYFFGATVLARCSLRYGIEKPLSARARTAFLGLTLTTTLGYVAQSLQFLTYQSPAPDDSVIHCLSLTLIWICLLLINLNTTSPVPLTCIGVAIIDLVLETAICVLTFLEHGRHRTRWPYSLVSLQAVTLLSLALFASLVISISFDTHPLVEQDETQPMLTADSVSVNSTASAASYGALNTQESQADSDERSEISDDDGDEDSDDKELKALRQQRLEQTGGWIGYLKAFKVFVPYIIPKESFRLQAYLVIIIFNVLGQAVLDVLQPRQLGIVINILASERRLPWKEILLWSAYGAAASDWCGLGAVSDYLKNRLIAWSKQKLTVAALDHVMGLSMDFHDSKDSGEIIKAVEQAGSIGEIQSSVVLDILPGVLNVLVAMWFINYLFDTYALLILVAVAITFIFATYHMTTLTSAARRTSAQRGRNESKIIYESVSSWYSIMCLNRRKYTMHRLSHAVEAAARAAVNSEDLYVTMVGLQDLSEVFGQLALTLLAAHRISVGTSSVGDLVTLQSYWATLMMPLYALGRSYRILNSNLVDAERLLQLFQQQPTVVDHPAAQTQPQPYIEGHVAFSDVQFAYPNRGSSLSDFNLTAKPGQMIALVGETGGGKSTVLKLLMRFYDVTAGQITLDGHDIRDLPLESLRATFGFVPQDTVLFNMSILENVRYGDPTATDAQVHAACRAAAIHDKIMGFPRGYASRVGERGVKLSGGERQRLAIARVFLRDPRVVLLDEATSAMDSRTEGRIQDALRRLTRGRTTFVIAHRLSTVVDADCILVVDRGRVVESGSHLELLGRGGRYADLWTKQANVVTT